MKKKYFTSPFLLLLLLGCQKKIPELILTSSESQKTPEPIMEAVREDDQKKPLLVIGPEDVLKIIVRQDGAPGMYLGEDGKVHGFYVDLERLVMEEMGQKYEFIAYDDIGSVLLGIKTGIYHSAIAVPDLPDYHSILNLSMTYEKLNFVTFVQQDNMDIHGNTREEIIKSLHGKRVGVQIQGHIYQTLIDIREIELLEYPTTTVALEELDKGLLDAVPDVKRTGRFYADKKGWKIKAVGDSIDSHEITTGFSKILDPSVLDRYNIALARILTDGRYESLYMSYFGELKDSDRP